jgi:hypothetical protein
VSTAPGSREPRHFVVVGASLAGLRAVEAARRSGFAGRITVIGAEAHLPYDRPPLSKDFLSPDQPADPVTFRSAAELREELDVRVLLAAPATGLDPQGRTVSVGGDTVDYDALVVATGADARRLPGTEGLSGVHVLRGLDDTRAIRRALGEGAPHRRHRCRVHRLRGRLRCPQAGSRGDDRRGAAHAPGPGGRSPRRAQRGPARPAERYATVPYFWSDWYGSRIQFAGLARGEETCAAPRLRTTWRTDQP